MKRHLQLRTALPSRRQPSLPLSLAVRTTALVTVLLAACQEAEPRDLGFTHGAQNLASDVTEPFYSSGDSFVGRWIGRAQEPLALTDDGQTPVYHFPSGSSQFALDIVSDTDQFGNHTLVGHLTFGAGAPLPPPTDPDVGYPVGFNYQKALSYAPNGLAGNPEYELFPFEGFDYEFTLEHVRSDGETVDVPDGVLDLSYTVNEPLDAWCQLQTPYPDDSGSSYNCVDNRGAGAWGGSIDGTGSCQLVAPLDTSSCPAHPSPEEYLECSKSGVVLAESDCNKLFLCEHLYCECDRVSCRAAGAYVGSAGRDRLEMRRSGNELVGVFDGTTFLNARNYKVPLGEVRFQRAE
jgi:hypothetical protein